MIECVRTESHLSSIQIREIDIIFMRTINIGPLDYNALGMLYEKNNKSGKDEASCNTF